MAAYLDDAMLLYLDKLVDWDTIFRLWKGDDVDVDAERAALRTVLETVAEICEGIEEEARPGWENAAKLVDGEVIHPPHVANGYEALRKVGLVSFAVREEYGGPELPAFLTNMILELLSRADSGLMTVVGLQAGVAEDIQKYGSEELRKTYLPRMASGELQGAMDLTEPQAGSDLGAIATRATEEEDGRIFLDGQKIWITNGGSGVHLVLARDADTYDQSKGTTRGLSLYLCPRELPDGSQNRLTVERLEHKLGIHGSPTAAIRFDHAEAFLVGKKGEGFKAMLDLMNNARIGVAAQGLGIAEAALAEAVAYAKQRKQFGVAIADQPLMKNMLSRMVLMVEGSRALLYRCCALLDHNRAIERRLASDELPDSERGELEKVHERNLTRIRLLTPLAKYMATENSDHVTRMAIQVHGGLGYMAESTVGKLHNDAIITTIYEGTSEIQVSFALKEIGKGALLVVVEELRKELDALGAESPFDEYAAKVRGGIEKILGASGALMSDFSYALMCAKLLADCVADVIVGTELLRQAKADPRRMDLAASWINRSALEIEANTRRIAEGTVARVERCERIIDLVRT